MTRGWLHLSTDELARRAHAEPTMGMVFVVVGDPGADPRQDGVGVGLGLDAGIVALERLHERLAHPVALGRAHRRKAGHKVQGCREGQRLGVRVGGASVRGWSGCEGAAALRLGAAAPAMPADAAPGPLAVEPAQPARTV